MQALLGLPERFVQKLAGPPVVRDGRRLAPEAQLLLRLFRLSRQPDVVNVSVDKARRSMDLQAASVALGQPIGAVRSFDVEGRPARLYTPTSRIGDRSSPTMLFFHGGYHTFGSLHSHDGALRHLAEQSGVQVLALDYRLAPEHPFPAGLDDCIAALRWLAAHPEAVGADPARLAVGGDSAGANLAAATVQATADNVDLAFQLLVYPVTDYQTTSESRVSLGDGFLLTHAAIKQAMDRYLPDAAQRTDPRADIAHGPISRRTPPTLVVTAGFDPLRDEGNAYAERLREAGVATELREYGDMIHGFFNMVTVGRRAPRYNREIAEAVRKALAD